MGGLKQRVRQYINKAVKTVKRAVEFIRDRLSRFIGIYTNPDTEHRYTPREEEIMDSLVNVMRKHFDFEGNPGEQLMQEDYDSRCLAIEDYAKDVLQVSGLENVQVVVTESTDIFPEGENISLGQADLNENVIYINARLLRMDDPNILNRMITTVLHETRHLMQRKAIFLEDTFDIPYETRYRWRMNVCNYIDSNEDFEGYQKQIVEVDARAYEAVLWDRATGKVGSEVSGYAFSCN